MASSPCGAHVIALRIRSGNPSHDFAILRQSTVSPSYLNRRTIRQSQSEKHNQTKTHKERHSQRERESERDIKRIGMRVNVEVYNQRDRIRE